MPNLIIGNWKMNNDYQTSKKFIQELKDTLRKTSYKIPEDLIFGIAPSDINLPLFKVARFEKPFILVSQNLSAHQDGAYTGEASASMIHSYGVEYTILGHSERRQYHHESSQEVNQKAQAAQMVGIIPLICVGETLEEYEAGQSKEVVQKQVEESTKGLAKGTYVIAYEPIWAIGTGKTMNPSEAQEMAAFIRTLTFENILIQYGGSVKPHNIAEYLNQDDINGALVGGASLKAESFFGLLQPLLIESSKA